MTEQCEKHERKLNPSDDGCTTKTDTTTDRSQSNGKHLVLITLHNPAISDILHCYLQSNITTILIKDIPKSVKFVDIPQGL